MKPRHLTIHWKTNLPPLAQHTSPSMHQLACGSLTPPIPPPAPLFPLPSFGCLCMNFSITGLSWICLSVDVSWCEAAGCTRTGEFLLKVPSPHIHKHTDARTHTPPPLQASFYIWLNSFSPHQQTSACIHTLNMSSHIHTLLNCHGELWCVCRMKHLP